MNVYSTFRRSDGSVVKLHMPCGDGHDVFGGAGNLHSAVQHGPRAPRRPPAGPAGADRGDPAERPGAARRHLPAGQPGRHRPRQAREDQERAAEPLLGPADVHRRQHPASRRATRSIPTPATRSSTSTATTRARARSASARTAATRSRAGGWAAEAPRVIAITFRHENPYYDDSYAVNSANLGPYGDAITGELMTEIDDRFRTMGASWARVADRRLDRRLGGARAADPLREPLRGHVRVLPRPGRLPLPPDREHVRRRQRVLPRARVEPRAAARRAPARRQRPVHDGGREPLRAGDRRPQPLRRAVGHLGGGLRAAGRDGYPARAWDKRHGRDRPRGVRALARDGPARPRRAQLADARADLVGKLHIWTGDDDTYYLENAVKLLEQLVRGRSARPRQATIEYGYERPHCYTPFADNQSLITADGGLHARARAAGRRPGELALLNAIWGGLGVHSAPNPPRVLSEWLESRTAGGA